LKKLQLEQELVSCLCGCGEIIENYPEEMRGDNGKLRLRFHTPRSFKNGHQNRLDNHPFWKGGKHYDSQGYVLILKKDHHFATKQGLVMEHRLVWEQFYQASLLPWANVHHKNGKRDDNRIENLEAMTTSNHKSMHAKISNHERSKK
jgi:hypothetical protein